MKKIRQIIGLMMLGGAIAFNLWIYRMEPTAQVDPNDNQFQFALVYRTNQIWDVAAQRCSERSLTYPLCLTAYLADHWVPNWNEGYNLPFYYSHVPQISIVAAYRMINLFAPDYSLFSFYHVITYALLCLLPLSAFLALRIMGLSWITAGLGALLASQISTDGFYGLDPPSFLWRGYGLSSQLFAAVWLPLALAASMRALTQKKYVPWAIAFVVLTTAGHLGIGMMAFLSLIPLAAAAPLTIAFQQRPLKDIIPFLKRNLATLCLIAGVSLFFLAYWIVPVLLTDVYRNFSFWDPVWKFNSYGAKEIITRLLNGALFDFGRLPFYTTLVFLGSYAVVSSPAGGLTGLFYLFLFFLLLYFGRITWGSAIDLVPGMREFHLSRFIVGVHLSGMLLAPIGLVWIMETAGRLTEKMSGAVRVSLSLLIAVLILVPIFEQTVRYAQHNDTLLERAHNDYAKQSADTDALISTLKELGKTAPGRVYAGRGGSWGREFRIAETPMYMYLSTYGIPTVLWMPETWSPNADTEQYFRENHAEDYDLYNIRYIATPANLPASSIQPFWRLIKSNPSWRLYEVPTSGYMTWGMRPAVVAADKYSYVNLIRLWIQSSDPKMGLYPELRLSSNPTIEQLNTTALPHFVMRDEVTFEVPDGTRHNLLSEPPKYVGTRGNIRVTDQTNDADMVFSANVSVGPDCTECFVILKQTYHPNWKATVDGGAVTSILVFPFFIGIPVSSGDHTVAVSYEPSGLKIILLGLALTACMIFAIIHTYDHYKHFSAGKTEKTSR